MYFYTKIQALLCAIMLMEDLLLLLLGLVWLGASYYQSQRKKKAEEERRSAAVTKSGDHNEMDDEEPSGKESFLDKMMETIDQEGSGLLQDLEKQASNQFSSGEIDDKNGEIAENEEVGSNSQAEESEESLTASAGLTNLSRRKKQVKNQQWARNLVRDFDGKKAVIYSEILNRPY